jgi:cysteine desulfurase
MRAPPLYLDHAATTPVHPRVEFAMAEVRAQPRANPASLHRPGRTARALLERARSRVATLLGVHPEEVYFVRGGTESDNLALQGRVFDRIEAGEPPGDVWMAHSAVEHAAVRETARRLTLRCGVEVRVLPVSPTGEVDLEALALSPSAAPPAVVSVQAVNSETGLILNLDPVLRHCRAAGIVLHVDAVQAVGRVGLPLGNLRPDLLSLSAHKMGGPAGAGLLIRARGVRLAPLLLGGGQEGGVRPGTLDVEAAVGTAEALACALETEASEGARLRSLRDGLEQTLIRAVPGLRVLGGEGPRAPHILAVGLDDLPRDLLPSALDVEGISASAGSACRSGSSETSPVLTALYGPTASRIAPLRLSLGWSTTAEALLVGTPRILEALSRVREWA